MIIYDEDDEISELYIVTEGDIGIGFSIMKAGFSSGSNIVISKR